MQPYIDELTAGNKGVLIALVIVSVGMAIALPFLAGPGKPYLPLLPLTLGSIIYFLMRFLVATDSKRLSQAQSQPPVLATFKSERPMNRGWCKAIVISEGEEITAIIPRVWLRKFKPGNQVHVHIGTHFTILSAPPSSS